MKVIKQGFMLIGMTIFNIGFSQQLKGIVLNEENQPLESAYIYDLNSESHTHTLENGQFVLNNVRLNDSLKIGLLGYTPVTMIVKDFKETLKIILREEAFQLDELVISEQLNALNTVTALDLQTTPVNSSQDVLRMVPGLIIGQHAGGGKAEQLFLRGFDLDHGTDIAINVDGMPVNMVSHAHGQGYSDLHFVIPETIKNIDFGKGPYYAGEGDFDTAGYVNFTTKNTLDENEISFGIGQFNSLRTLGMFNLLDHDENQHAYMALEYLETDGPFESPQNFNRLNIFGKYVYFTPNNDKLAFSVSQFTSRWDASGQIPQRAVDSGLISRFGAIDDTEGGATARRNLNLEFTKQMSENTRLKANVYYTKYDFKLFSNFTFYLEDPVNGDQIKQQEFRNLYGFNTDFRTKILTSTTPLSLDYGVSLRYDSTTNSELSKTINRSTLNERVKLGDINQSNASAFLKASIEPGKFKIIPGVRLEHFNFMYNDKLQGDGGTDSKTAFLVNPKLNVFYNPKENIQWFIKSGIGFHSNDTRVVVSNIQGESLPRAYGLDFGNIWKPDAKIFINTTLWYLYLEQEFVYVGDAGVIEPSGKTERYGIDFSFRYQINDFVYFNNDITLTRARSLEKAKDQSYIPLAPNVTSTGGLSLKDFHGFSGSFKYRYLADRPANETNSIVAKGYFVSDFDLNYTINKLTISAYIQNIFNTQWNETQFATTSRLQNEDNPVDEIHFTPGTPFFIKTGVTYRF